MRTLTPRTRNIFVMLLSTFFIFGLSACDSGPGLSEICEGTDCLELAVTASSQCLPEGGKGLVSGTVSTTSGDPVPDGTRYEIVDASGETVSGGTVRNGEVPETELPNGQYTVRASSEEATAAEDDTQFDCETKPGVVRIRTKECRAESGFVRIEAEDGIEAWTLNANDGSNVASGDEDGNQTLEISGLEDGQYSLDLETSAGSDETVNFTFDCTDPLPGSGEGSISGDCVFSNGGSEVSGTITGSFSNETTEIELVEDDVGIVDTRENVEANEEVSFDGLDNGDYFLRGSGQNGESRETDTVTLSCEVQGPGDFDVTASCNMEDGTVIISSDKEFDLAKLYLENGDVLEQEPSGDEATFEDITDGDHEASIVRNGRESNRQDVSVSCDLSVRECTFTATFGLNGDPKTDEYSLGTKVILDRDPIQSVEFEVRNAVVSEDAEFVLDFYRNGRAGSDDEPEYMSDQFSQGNLLIEDVPADFVDTNTEYEVVVRVIGGPFDTVEFDNGEVIIRYEFRPNGNSAATTSSRSFTPPVNAEPF